MGKHEREKVFITETIVSDLLNRKPIDSKRKSHEFFAYASTLANRIRSDFPSLKKSEHIGNAYGASIGDIKLTLGGGEDVFIELKFLRSGTGTRANVGQDTLTEFHLFKGEDIVPWSGFRSDKKHNDWVLGELDRFGDYPNGIQGIKGKRAIYERAGYLKQVLGITRENCEPFADEVLDDLNASSRESLVADIVKNIIVKDRQEKKAYISYLKTLEQNHDNIKKFLFLILAGAHTRESLKAQWSIDLDIILATLRHKYYVYYIYKGTPDINVEDHSQKLNNLLEKQIFISFRDDQTNVLASFYDDTGDEIPILRVVFHWKNKFQGIETPCLNVFDEKYLTGGCIL